MAIAEMTGHNQNPRWTMRSSFSPMAEFASRILQSRGGARAQRKGFCGRIIEFGIADNSLAILNRWSRRQGHRRRLKMVDVGVIPRLRGLAMVGDQ